MLGRIAPWFAALLVTACAVLPEPQALPKLSRVPAAFELSARVAVSQGERNEIARLRWTRRAKSDVWVVATPIGNEVARIESGPEGATLHRAGGPAESAASFQALTERVLGIRLDPERLSAWLHGLPVPEDAAQGWRVSVEASDSKGEVAIARRITAAQGETTVRLFVDRYEPLVE